MKVLGFCEGVREDMGGIGLDCVAPLHHALAERGMQVALAVAGRPMSAARPWLRDHLADVLGSPEGRGATGVVGFPAYGRWAFSPAMYRAAVSGIRPDVITLHSLYSFPVLAGFLSARRFRAPYVMWPHGVLAPFQRTIAARKKAAYDAIVSRRILDGASAVIFTAEGERDEATEVGLKAPSIVIPLGLDMPAASSSPGRFRDRFLKGSKGPLILYLGRLNAKKGLDIAIRAMDTVRAACPTAMLAIAGSAHPPEYEETVRRWAAESAQSDAIVFTGTIVGEEKADAFADADVFVLPSAAENFGYAMFEAMAARVPVVVSSSLNYAAHVKDAGAGVVVDRDPVLIGKAIVELLQHRDAAKAMGAKGPGLCAQYSWAICGGRMASALEAVVSGAPLPSELKPEYPSQRDQ